VVLADHLLSFPVFAGSFRRISGASDGTKVAVAEAREGDQREDWTFTIHHSSSKYRKAEERADEQRQTRTVGFCLRLAYLFDPRVHSTEERDMTLADLTLVVFTVCNSARVLAYVPQIWKTTTDDQGAKAISSATWALFLVSHISTAAYAVVNRGDWGMTTMFLADAAACAAILLLAAWRRTVFQKAQTTEIDNIVPLRRAA
jgi:hypothetical protein